MPLADTDAVLGAPLLSFFPTSYKTKSSADFMVAENSFSLGAFSKRLSLAS